MRYCPVCGGIDDHRPRTHRSHDRAWEEHHARLQEARARGGRVTAARRKSATPQAVEPEG